MNFGDEPAVSSLERNVGEGCNGRVSFFQRLT